MKIGGGTTYLPFHRIKMMAFSPVDNMEKLQVNHIDGNKKNNSLKNLEWVTVKQNINHAWENGVSNHDTTHGEKSNLSHYTEKQAKQVVELLKTNQYTDKEIAEITHTSARSFVAKIRRKETWKHLTQNYQNALGKKRNNSSFNKKSSTTISEESTL